SCELFEGFVLTAVIKKVGRRNAGAATAVANVAEDPDKLIRITKWQRPDHDRIDETEDRSVCADAESECDQRDHGESRPLQQSSDAIADVFDYRVHSPSSISPTGHIGPIHIAVR